MITEFKILSNNLGQSGCAKKQIGAGTYVKGVFISAFNACSFEGDHCPRLTMPSGIGYEFCQAKHAEASLVEYMRESNMKSDGVAWVFGHYWACEPCASDLKSVGVREIRIMEAF